MTLEEIKELFKEYGRENTAKSGAVSTTQKEKNGDDSDVWTEEDWRLLKKLIEANRIKREKKTGDDPKIALQEAAKESISHQRAHIRMIWMRIIFKAIKIGWIDRVK